MLTKMIWKALCRQQVVRDYQGPDPPKAPIGDGSDESDERGHSHTVWLLVDVCQAEQYRRDQHAQPAQDNAIDCLIFSSSRSFIRQL